MADAERKRRIKHAHEPSNLTYGHFGTAEYDEESKEWHFLRRFDHGSPQKVDAKAGRSGSASTFHLLRVKRHESVTSTPRNNIDTAATKKLTPHQSLRFAPELLPSFEVGAAGLQTDLNSTIASSPALSSSRLAFGYASSAFERGHRDDHHQVPIMVQSVQNTIQIMPLTPHRESWQDENGVETFAEVPALSHHDTTGLGDIAEPVLQICFSNTRDFNNRPFIAVRRSSCTSIVRVIIEEKASGSYTVQPLLNLPLTRTGGYQHSDITFHPYDSSLFGIVDTHGNWSVWKIHGKQTLSSRILVKAHLLGSNKIFAWDFQAPPPQVGPYYDGWHRFCWLSAGRGGIEVILAANRQCIFTADRRGTIQYPLDVRLGPRHAQNWILEIKAIHCCPSFCFILTSQRIAVLKMVECTDKTSNQRIEMEMACSWNHFRAKSDLYLKISILEVPVRIAGTESIGTTSVDATVYCLLYSNTNPMCTLYQFFIERKGSRVSVCDPVILSLPDELKAAYDKITDISLKLMEVVPDTHDGGSSDHDFVMLHARMRGGAVLEALYRLESSNNISSAAQTRQFGYGIPLTRDRRFKSSRTIDSDDSDSFVVDDHDEEDAKPVGTNTERQTSWYRHLHRPKPSGITDWSDVIEWEGTVNECDSLATKLESIDQYIAENADTESATRLLIEQMQKVTTGDLDTDSEKLRSWLEERLSQYGKAPSRDGNFELASILQVPPPSLAHNYDELVDSFVYPMGKDVSDRTRVQTERLARQLALELSLSSVALRPRASDREANGNSQDSQEDLRISQPLLSNPHRSLLSSSQTAMSEPSPGSTKSALDRLALYTSIDISRPLDTNNTTMTSILEHLPTDITLDPDQYSYRDTELNLALARNEMNLQSLDPRTRRKVEKQAVARKRKLERQQKLTQQAGLERNLLPSVLNSSQLPVREVQSSQGGQADQSQSQNDAVPGLSMTQPERGIFGGRNADSSRTKVKGKAKARREGF